MSDKFDISKINLSVQSNHISQIQQSIRASELAMYEVVREKARKEQEAVEREKETIHLLKAILENKPEIRQEIGQYFHQSTVGVAQVNQDNATGQVIVNNGLDFEEYKRLRNELTELLELVRDEEKQEIVETIEMLDSEVTSQKPKKGVIKAGMTYISKFFEDVVANPAKVVIAANVQDYLAEKSPTLIAGLNKFLLGL